MRTCELCGFDANRDTARFCASCGRSFGSHALLAKKTVLRKRYEIVRTLGKGGMGAVYLVRDQGLYGKHWALKELLERFDNPAERAEAVAQFQSEVQMLVDLRHPNLPQVVDVFEENGRHYMVMEFIEGQTLREMLEAASEGCLPEDQLRNWVIQICDVLDYLHSQNPPVIFRDLKPANIMVTPQGQVKLIDFGVARLFNPIKGTDTLKMGTVGYAPPEQYAGKGQTTTRSDVYALGATLHELLTGSNPEEHPFVFAPVRRLNRQVSGRMARAIAKAVQLDPEDRFPSIEAMSKSLMKGKRRSLPALLLLLPVLILLVGGAGWFWQRLQPTEPTPTPEATMVAQVAPSPTASPRPTSTPAPTLTPTPVPPTSTPFSTPFSSPTPTLSQNPTQSPTPTRLPTESGPTPSPTAEGNRPTPNPTATAAESSPTPLPVPLAGETGRLFYTIDAGETYYLATTDPSWSQGRVIDPATYAQSTCGGGNTASTLLGQSINLFYGYRCSIGSPKECPSPDGEYKVSIWHDAAGYSLSVYRISDNTLLHSIYQGQLNDDEPILWAPDSSRFYFTIDHTLHQASPQSAGYDPVLPIAYESYLSPDGSMILYLQPVGSVGAYDVWVANADGSNPRNVTNAADAYKLCPRWGGY